MTWIEIIEPEQAEGRLQRIYARASGGGRVDQILRAHSLRPHTLEGHMGLYRSVLHHPHNGLEPAFAEAIGVLVSRINRCAYCVAHHSAGMKRALGDERRAEAWLSALDSDDLAQVFESRERAALAWAERLTRAPAECSEQDIETLRDAGWSDGEILEINQVVSYFCYANRTVLGLGVTTDGEDIGASSAG